MADEIWSSGFNFDPLPLPYPGVGDADFSQWVREQESAFDDYIAQQRIEFQNAILRASVEWGEILQEEQEAQEEFDDEKSYTVRSQNDLPPDYVPRKKRYFSIEEIEEFFDEAGLWGYGPLVFQRSDGLWSWALPPDKKKKRQVSRRKSTRRSK